MSSSPPISEEARRVRVMAHMNKDHGPELARYLEAWTGVVVPVEPSSSSAGDDNNGRPTATLMDLQLDSMAIAGPDGTVHRLPISPPMASFADSREAMVRLDEEARRRLAAAAAAAADVVTVREFRRPRGLAVYLFIGVAFYFLSYFTLGRVLEGDGAPWASVRTFWDAVFPGGVETYAWVVKTIFWPVVGIHLTEVAVLDRTRLARHGVVRGSVVWWTWMVSGFFEGFTSFMRFDGLVRELRESEGKAK